MADSLESAFADYLELIEAASPKPRVAGVPSKNLILLTSENQRINAEVEKLEQTSQFQSLAAVVEIEASAGGSAAKFHKLGTIVLRTFLRLSGAYEAHLSTEPFAKAADESLILARRFREGIFSAREKRLHLAPIEFVSFAHDVMEFDGFKIQRFTQIELADLLKQHVCRLFFPWASVDTGELSSYWFLVCEETAELSLGWDLNWGANVEVEYSPFSGALKQAFRRLILYSWKDPFGGAVDLHKAKSTDQWTAPFLFSIPFSLTTSDSWLVSPNRAPDLSVLATQPWVDAEGREGGMEPVVGYWLTDQESAEFCSFISQIDQVIKRAEIDCPEWCFADTAMNFFEKAFLSKGVEQLLWHITTIEALVGENVDPGLTKILKTRTGLALGRSTDESKQIGKNFEELYSLRSGLVHGNASLPDRDIYLSHLGQAREMARKLIVWMLHYLASIREAGKGSSHLPSRRNLLKVLDMDAPNREEISALLALVPKDFPNPTDW